MTTPTHPTNPYGMSRDTRTACPATLQRRSVWLGAQVVLRW
jgi:hypothetical protein